MKKQSWFITVNNKKVGRVESTLENLYNKLGVWIWISGDHVHLLGMPGERI